ncbi:MAG: YfcE family phosphodiesterase [Clostridia bacterium]|nr:YfcE family phosphodiesterase [Clostridia bacterium]
MQLIVLSDSHGRASLIDRVIAAHPNAAAFIFLGDGLRDFDEATRFDPRIAAVSVAGNCDLFADAPTVVTPTWGAHRFYITHGHLHGVKDSLLRLACAAREKGASVALFGHTHRPFNEKDGDLLLFNPGSLGQSGTYGVLDVIDSGVAATHHNI